tara:strand:- start:24936 stop:25274 length:339 start_codon:yes stop_codon:yes gene_type:complete
LQNAKDKHVFSRLTKDLLAITKTDNTNEKGLRILQDGNLSLSENFDSNLKGKLGATLFATYTKAFNRVSDDATLNFAAFSPTMRIAALSGTTYFKVVMGAIELDFEIEVSVF